MVDGAVGIPAPTWARDGLGSRRVDGEHVAATWRRPAIAVSGCQPAPEHEEDVGLRGRGAEFKAHDRRDLGQARSLGMLVLETAFGETQTCCDERCDQPAAAKQKDVFCIHFL